VPVSQFSVGTDPNKTRLAKDVSSLLDPNGTENFSDVTLVGAEGEREFRCHKIVLHRLPVLRRLIKESSAGGGDDGALRLKLDGVPDHLLEHVVKWLYGQPLSAELSLSVLVQLATVAKRQLGSAQLQQACESTFGMGINCVSVCQRLEDLASFDADEHERQKAAGDGVDLSHLQLTAADLRGFYERCFTLIARNWDLLKKDRQPELRSLEALARKHSPRVAALLKGDTRAAAAAAVAEAKQSDAEAEAEQEEAATADQEDKEDCLADSLFKFVDNALYSDVKLVVEGHPEVHAHKAILCARSSYFRAMLTAGMREATDGVIQIRDLSRETLMAILRYIYAAEYYYPSLFAHLCPPRPVSYQRRDSLFCVGCASNHLRPELNEETVVQLLMAAHLYGLLSLQERLEAFIEQVRALCGVCVCVCVLQAVCCWLPIHTLDFVLHYCRG
jgi:hypothetical protein